MNFEKPKQKVAEYDSAERLLVLDNGETYDCMSRIVLGGNTFYVKLHENRVPLLAALEQEIKSAEDTYPLNQILQVLQSRNFVIAVDDEGEVIEGSTARAQFFVALRELEGYRAQKLRERLAKIGEDW